MKTKLEIFSSKKLINFFNNLDIFFDINLNNLDELKNRQSSTRLSVIFFDDHISVEEKILKNISRNENFIFIFKESSIPRKLTLDFKKTITSPLSISKFFDMINEFINKKKHIFKNIDLNNSFITNIKTKEKVHLTQAENLILSKLLTEKSINKKLLERDALQIKEDLNTSSMESHLNRIRKKLKTVDSDFSVSSKDSNIVLEIINHYK